MHHKEEEIIQLHKRKQQACIASLLLTSWRRLNWLAPTRMKQPCATPPQNRSIVRSKPPHTLTNRQPMLPVNGSAHVAAHRHAFSQSASADNPTSRRRSCRPNNIEQPCGLPNAFRCRRKFKACEYSCKLLWCSCRRGSQGCAGRQASSVNVKSQVNNITSSTVRSEIPSGIFAVHSPRRSLALSSSAHKRPSRRR